MNLIYRRIIPFLLIALAMVNGGANISAQERSKGLLIRVIDDETLQPLPGVLVHYVGKEMSQMKRAILSCLKDWQQIRW